MATVAEEEARAAFNVALRTHPKAVGKAATFTAAPTTGVGHLASAPVTYTTLVDGRSMLVAGIFQERRVAAGGLDRVLLMALLQHQLLQRHQRGAAR